MYRGTTDTVTIKLPVEYPVQSIDQAFVSFEQYGSKVLEKSLTDMSLDVGTNSLIAALSQEDTLTFAVGDMKFQLRFTIGSEAYATQDWTEPVLRIIKDGKI